ncbi:MAG: acylphosphatase [Acidiferrobacterales bacterium]
MNAPRQNHAGSRQRGGTLISKTLWAGAAALYSALIIGIELIYPELFDRRLPGTWIQSLNWVYSLAFVGFGIVLQGAVARVLSRLTPTLWRPLMLCLGAALALLHVGVIQWRGAQALARNSGSPRCSDWPWWRYALGCCLNHGSCDGTGCTLSVSPGPPSLVRSTSANRCMRFLVSGRVQGVFYRGTTQTTAKRLGLRGFARNLADGRVEVVACGESTGLKELENWLWQGPPHARVTEVVAEEIPARDFIDFRAC